MESEGLMQRATQGMTKRVEYHPTVESVKEGMTKHPNDKMPGLIDESGAVFCNPEPKWNTTWNDGLLKEKEEGLRSGDKAAYEFILKDVLIKKRARAELAKQTEEMEEGRVVSLRDQVRATKKKNEQRAYVSMQRIRWYFCKALIWSVIQAIVFYVAAYLLYSRIAYAERSSPAREPRVPPFQFTPYTQGGN